MLIWYRGIPTSSIISSLTRACSILAAFTSAVPSIIASTFKVFLSSIVLKKYYYYIVVNSKNSIVSFEYF